MKKIELSKIVDFCNLRVDLKNIKDFPGAENGLQFENDGWVTKIGAAVDAGRVPFEKAKALGIDFLIVHHGLFWTPFSPVIGARYSKIKLLIESNCAVYGSHLPLDCHPEIGNNAILIDKLGLNVTDRFLNYEGNDIGFVAEGIDSREELKRRLKQIFPYSLTCMEEGNPKIKRIGILTGSGSSAVDHLKNQEIDTFITGELKQNFFNQAQEEDLNLFCCGHYATETFGVNALANEVARKFNLEFEFVPTNCPL